MMIVVIIIKIIIMIVIMMTIMIITVIVILIIIIVIAMMIMIKKIYDDKNSSYNDNINDKYHIHLFDKNKSSTKDDSVMNYFYDFYLHGSFDENI